MVFDQSAGFQLLYEIGNKDDFSALGLDDFESLKVIGRGAFGEVCFFFKVAVIENMYLKIVASYVSSVMG